jgi:CheY-like chemotaxis protein
MYTVLVAEDDPDIRMLVVFRLGLAGHHVIEAANGIEALELIRTRRPDGVVLDVSMPGMTGLEVCAAVRADPDDNLRRMPLLILSAYANEREIDAGLQAGADLYLTKPFTAAELNEAVDSVLSRTGRSLAAAAAGAANRATYGTAKLVAAQPQEPVEKAG